MFDPSHAGWSPPLGAAVVSPTWGKMGSGGWLLPSATGAGGADTHHGGTVTPQAGMWEEGSSAGQAGEGVPAGRAPGTALPDVGSVPVGHPGRFWGHCPHAAPSATACPGHSLGPSLPGPCQGPLPLPWGSQGDTKWGPYHQEMAQTGSHKRTHRCPSAWGGGTSMASARAAMLGSNSASDGSATGWPGRCPLFLISVPTVAITPLHPRQQGWREWQNLGGK